ncbi:response regulator [Caulobacter soli]|uniref:response regulator n=1 Tax=Caulobacter soli TaxID=2708539 RepID=UPI001FE7695A|nr:response regulator transcription factor [Caulobacter soli]
MMLAKAPIRVLIVDDHAVVRDGVAALLERQPDMEAVGEAADGAEALAQFRALAPDVTLMDVQMRGAGGLEATEAIRRLSPQARILVLTTYSGDAQAIRAIRAGAAGYLLKSCIRRELLDAIRTVHGGGRYISAEIAHQLATHALDEPLTDRELTILRLLADGHANKEVGYRLDLSTDTIKSHLKTLYAKLGVDDRTHAVTVAARRGYIER